MRIQPIITRRLKPRNYENTDMDFAMSIWNNPKMNKYMPDPNFEDMDERYLRSMETLQDDEECCYLIAEALDTGDRIGTCSFIPSQDGLTYDLGCCVHMDFWNQGYVTEMEQGMIDYAKVHGAKKITAPINKDNAPSIAVVKKLGFHQAGETFCKKYGTDIIMEEYMFELDI